MIRILHTSDWHLGRYLYGRSLLEDQKFALSSLLQLIEARKPQALLISGDIFDRSLPPEEAVNLLNYFLSEAIVKHQIEVFMIPGNHDSNERIGFAASLLRDRHLTIFSKIKDCFEPATLVGASGVRARIFGIPFLEPSEVEHHLNLPRTGSHDLALQELCTQMLTAKVPAQDSKDNNRAGSESLILLCHAFVAGGSISESEKEISIGGSSHVDKKTFEAFNYTALGHLHRPQNISSDTNSSSLIRYSGSLLPYSKSEVNQVKSVTEIRISPGLENAENKIEIEILPIPALRELRYIEGELQNLLAEGIKTENPSLKEDFIIAGLTDKGAQIDAFAKLRAIYPNLLHVSRTMGYRPELLPAAELRKREDRSDLDLFSNFFLACTGDELSDDERLTFASTLINLKSMEREELER